MKKAIAIVLGLVLVFGAFFAGLCVGRLGYDLKENGGIIGDTYDYLDRSLVKAHKSDGDKIEDIEVLPDNSIGDGFFTDTYLTKDYFFYTSFDPASNIGDGCAVMKYDLHTAKVTSVSKGKDIGSADNMLLLGDCLFFTAYGETNVKHGSGTLPGGYCVFRYDIKNDSIERIFATPNTVYDVRSFMCGEALFFVASSASQTDINEERGPHWVLYSYSGNELTVVKDFSKQAGYDGCVDIKSDGVKTTLVLRNFESYEGLAYTVSDGKLNFQGKVELSDEKTENAVSRTFGKWKVEEKTIETAEDKAEPDDCGYKYTVRYSISDKDKTYALSKASYMHYYA